MPNEVVKLSGSFEWAKTIHPDDKFGEPKWKVTLRPDQMSVEKILEMKAEGVKNTLGKDEKGFKINFSRPVSKVMKGEVVKFNPPVVTDMTGEPITDKIGDGSEGDLYLTLYSHSTPGGGKAKAARFDGLRISKLVEVQSLGENNTNPF